MNNLYHVYKIPSEQRSYELLFSEKNKCFLYSLVASVHSSLNQFNNLTLVSDEYTKNFFTEYLALPYSDYKNAFEDVTIFNQKNDYLFMLPKIYFYSNYNNYCYIDTDLFFTKNIKFENINNLLFSNKYELDEKRKEVYTSIFLYIKKICKNYPKWFDEIEIMNINKSIGTCFINSNDIRIKNYFEEIFKFIKTNFDSFLKIKYQYNLKQFDIYFNTFLEEFLLYEYLKINNIDHKVLTKDNLSCLVHCGNVKNSNNTNSIRICNYIKSTYPEYTNLIDQFIKIYI